MIAEKPLWAFKKGAMVLTVSPVAAMVFFAPIGGFAYIVAPGMEKLEYFTHDDSGAWDYRGPVKVAAVPSVARYVGMGKDDLRKCSAVYTYGGAYYGPRRYYGLALHGPFYSPLELSAREMVTNTPHGKAQFLIDAAGGPRFGGPGWVAIPPNVAALSVNV